MTYLRDVTLRGVVTVVLVVVGIWLMFWLAGVLWPHPCDDYEGTRFYQRCVAAYSDEPEPDGTGGTRYPLP